MKELFERLVKAWPEKSQWKIAKGKAIGLHWIEFMLHGSGMSHRIYAEATHHDLESAVARTIIEDELIRLGIFGYAIMHVKEGWWTEVFWSEIDEGVKSPFVPTRTEALLRVAVEAFEAASKGEK